MTKRDYTRQARTNRRTLKFYAKRCAQPEAKQPTKSTTNRKERYHGA